VGGEQAIGRAIENAPDHVAADNGFLAGISELERIAERDTKIALIILLIDIISFGFELAAVLAKVTSYVPTTYAALLARDAYLRSARIVDEMMTQLKQSEILPRAAPFPAPDPLGDDSDDSAPPLPPSPPEIADGSAPEAKKEAGTAAEQRFCHKCQ
jgi:hypothetical protein